MIVKFEHIKPIFPRASLKKQLNGHLDYNFYMYPGGQRDKKNI